MIVVKRSFSLINLLPLLLIGSGCTWQADATKPKETLPSKYPPQSAIQQGDVVDFHGNITNSDKLARFISNYEKGQKDFVRITKYTIEGDPVLYELSFNGKSIAYTVDNTRDHFAGNGKGEKTFQCSKIGKKQEEKFTDYYLSDCSDSASQQKILSVPNDKKRSRE